MHRRARPAPRATRLAAALTLALALRGSPALAQQSLFNVPSTTGTAVGHVFAQEQLSLGDVPESSTTLDVGILPFLEAGVNALHVDLRGTGFVETHDDDVLAGNASLFCSPWPWLSLQVGAELGGGLVRPNGDSGLFVLAWGTARFSLPDHRGEIVVGGYAGDVDALGSAIPGGGLLGIEIPLSPRLLHLVCDWVIGDGDLGVAVLGVAVLLADEWQLSMGLQVPSPGTQNTLGVVIELTHTTPAPREPT